MVSSRGIYIYANNKILYHVVLFVSFVAAVLLMPMISDFLVQYIQNEILLQIASYAVAYIGAMYIIPEVTFIILKMMMDQ